MNPKEVIKEFLPGEALSARKFDQLRRSAQENITGVGGVLINRTSSSVYIDHPGFDSVWVGIISDNSEYSDSRYAVQRGYLSNSNGSVSDEVNFSLRSQPYSDVEIVVNLPENDPQNSDALHFLRPGREVMVYEGFDQSVPLKKRFYMIEHPLPCFDHIYTVSDIALNTLLSDVRSSDLTGDVAASDSQASDVGHWYLKGQHYLDSDYRVNPWSAVNLRKTGMFFPVLVSSDGGIAGNSSDACTGTYLITNLASDIVLGSAQTPEKKRPAAGQMAIPADESVGSAFFDTRDDSIALWDANETLAVSDCE